MDWDYRDELLAVMDSIGADNVLGAWETGSRAYNFAHAASDADITIIYTLPKVAYVLEDEIYRNGFNTEQIDIEFAVDVEFEGWDVRRFRKLAFEFDPMLYETLLSPAPYIVPEPLQKIADELKRHPNPIPLFKQYQSSAEHIYYQRLDDGVIPKKYLFHTVRNQLMAEYIRQQHEYPTLDFQQFIQDAPESVFTIYSRDEVEDILHAKQNPTEASEKIPVPHKNALEAFFDFELTYENHIPEEGLDKPLINECIAELLATEESCHDRVMQL